MPTSRSGAGGEIVTYRRKKRIAATPYDRPPPRSSPPKSPNWFSGVVVPSALSIASGAGKILSSIFSDSGSSSSEDEECGSEDDIVNDNLPEIPYNRENTLNEENVTSSEMMRYKPELQLSMWRSETKKIIEQLIMKETFSREECNTLKKVLNSRVMDWSMDTGEKSSVAGSPGEKLHHAVQEAKRWFQKKRAGLSSVTGLALGTPNLSSETLEHVETGGGSPVDVARSYMKAMQPWASSGSYIELETPWTVSMKLFQEGTLYSAGHYSTSSSKNRRSFGSGLWDIQEELRRVRSRATDMLRSPTTKTDPSHIAVAPIKMRSPVAGEEVFPMGERMTEPQSLRLHNPIDALVHSGVNSLAALESRQEDGKAIEALLSKPDTSISGNNEVSEAVQADAECPASKLIHPLSPNHAEELHSAFNWLSDVRRWHEESDKENINEERGAALKLERELKRLQTSVNYYARKEKG